MKLTHEEQTKAWNALQAGKITQAEYDFLLGTHHFDKPKDNHNLIVGGLVVVLVTVLGSLFLGGGAITGLVTAEWNESTFNNYTLIDLNVSDISGVRVTGILTDGTVTINALIGNESYLVYSGANLEPRIWTEQASYKVNETINVVVDLENYTLWLIGDNRMPIENDFIVTEVGDYTIEALGDEKLSIEISIVEGNTTTREREPVTFTETCDESCVVAPSNETTLLEILTEGDVTVTDVIVTASNEPPRQTQPLPDVVLDEEAVLNLSEYFTDDEPLNYEVNNLLGIIERLDGDILELEGTLPGTYRGVIYASDGQTITTAEFEIIVPEETTEVNETAPIEANETVNTTNETVTVNETTNQTPTNQTANQTSTPVVAPSCDNPDVNQRPPECFDNFAAAFNNVIAPLNNRDQEQVGRFTRIGNLIISGNLVENSLGTPGSRDFTLGYAVTEDFEQTFITTTWINADGDLHLRGRLSEELITFNNPPRDSFIVRNANGLILGYFDQRTGDLYLRGNLVQNGRP